jgi:hypothetical protein
MERNGRVMTIRVQGLPNHAARFRQDHRKEEGAMADDLKKGDRVEWNTPQGKTRGTVERKLTSETDIKGHHVAASKDNPEFLVKSEKSGKEAAHKPESLKKIAKKKSD